MDYHVRNAKMEDLPRIEEIYAFARDFMARNGNPNQWGKSEPAHEQLVQDIMEERLFVIAAQDDFHGVFFFDIGQDLTQFLHPADVQMACGMGQGGSTNFYNDAHEKSSK